MSTPSLPVPRPRPVIGAELAETFRRIGEKDYYRAVLEAEIVALRQHALALNQEASRLPSPPKGP